MNEENKKFSLVIADCNADLRTAIAEKFNKEKDFEILGSCSDGYETFELVKTKNPDVLVMDVVLPGLDGFELIENIMNSTQVMKKPKIVVISSLAHEGFINKAKIILLGELI